MFIGAIGCEPLQLRRVQLGNSHRLDVYRANGGYEAIKKVLDSMSPDDVINEVKKSSLRGRAILARLPPVVSDELDPY